MKLLKVIDKLNIKAFISRTKAKINFNLENVF